MDGLVDRLSTLSTERLLLLSLSSTSSLGARRGGCLYSVVIAAEAGKLLSQVLVPSAVCSPCEGGCEDIAVFFLEMG